MAGLQNFLRYFLENYFACGMHNKEFRTDSSTRSKKQIRVFSRPFAAEKVLLWISASQRQSAAKKNPTNNKPLLKDHWSVQGEAVRSGPE
jgi:hypothetical protein